MPAPLSVDLRLRLVAYAKKHDASREELAEIFGVGPATAYRWVVEANEGKTEPAKAPGAEPLISDEQLPELRALVAEKPDATLQDLCDAWERKTGVHVSVTTMHRTLDEKLNLTRKKRQRGRRNNSVRT